MKQTPFHIRALRAGAIVLAVGAGSYLVMSTQRAANPEPAKESPQPQENTPADDALITGDPFPTPGDEKPTFIYGSKSFVPEAHVLSDNLVENAEARLPELTNRTFMYSSKSISAVTIELPEIANPFPKKDPDTGSTTPDPEKKKAVASPPKQ